VGQGNKDTKRNLGRNPFFKPGILGPDQVAPKDWSAVNDSNKAWLNQEGYKGIRNFFNQGWNDNRMKYGPGGHLKPHQEIKRQDQQNKLNRLKEEGNPWALKAENQQYYGDTSTPAIDNKQGKNQTGQNGQSNTSITPVDDGGRQAWLDATANSPAAKAFGNSESANEMRWQTQLGHRDWLASNNRGSKYTIDNKDARYASAKAEALGNAGSQTLEQSMLGMVGAGGQTQATTENQQDGTRSVDAVQPVSGLEIGQQPNTKGFNTVSNSSQIMTHANQTGGFEGATGIGTSNMQPNTALTTSNEAGVEPANINGLDGNVDNPANDLVSQYKVQALGDFYVPSEDTDPLQYFRRDTRSNLGNKIMGKK